MPMPKPKTWSDTIKTSARWLLPAVAMAGALSVATAGSAEEYDLDITHVLTVGQRFTLEGEAYNNMELLQFIGGGEPVEEITSAEINIEGELEILQVDDEGGVTQLALSVARYDIEVNSEGVELDTDQRILATAEGDGVDFTYEDGGALPDEAVQVLDELLGDYLSTGGDEDADEAGEDGPMMGFDEPRSPGERWELEAAEFFDAMAEGDGGGMLLGEDAEVSSNEGHFVELNTDDFGEEVAVVEIELEVEGFTFAEGEFPEFMVLEQAELEFAAEVWVPLDPASGQKSETFTMEIAFRVAGTVPENNIKVAVEVEADGGRTVVLRRIEE